ncbi:MAG: transporter [Bacteroidales bacterium]|nr:transporter [Bacteroidales bacterium]
MIIFLLHITAYPGYTQNNGSELITDRPDQTESSAIVPAAHIQIETGFAFEHNNTEAFSIESYTMNTTLLRFGLLSNFELRAGLGYQKDRFEPVHSDSAVTTKGLSPLYTGFKVKITDERKWLPEIAFLGGIVIPFTAGKDYKPAHSAVNLRFAFSHTLSDIFSIGYNLGVEFDGESAIPGYFYSLATGIEISDKLGMFIESYGTIYEKGTPEYFADAGFTYLLLPDLQFDISMGKEITKKAADYFFGTGLSYRFH